LRQPQILQTASIGGVPAVTWLVCLVNGIALECWVCWRVRRLRDGRTVCLAVALGLVACALGYSRARVDKNAFEAGPRQPRDEYPRIKRRVALDSRAMNIRGSSVAWRRRTTSTTDPGQSVSTRQASATPATSSAKLEIR
jgi:hypothetical protein